MKDGLWHVARVLKLAPGFGPGQWVEVASRVSVRPEEELDDVAWRTAKEDHGKHADYRAELVGEIEHDASR